MHLVTLSFDDGFAHARHGVNPHPTRDTRILRTTGHGPGNCEQHMDACITALLAEPSGWLVYNTHGLDDEGWGPIGSAYLARLLDRLQAVPTVRVVTTGSVFAALDAGRNFAPAVSTP